MEQTNGQRELDLNAVLKSMPQEVLNDAAQHLTDWLSGYNVGHADKKTK